MATNKNVFRWFEPKDSKDKKTWCWKAALGVPQFCMEAKEVKHLTKAKWTAIFPKAETRGEVSTEKIDKYQLILLFDISQQEMVVIANLNYQRQCWTVNKTFPCLC